MDSNKTCLESDAVCTSGFNLREPATDFGEMSTLVITPPPIYRKGETAVISLFYEDAALVKLMCALSTRTGMIWRAYHCPKLYALIRVLTPVENKELWQSYITHTSIYEGYTYLHVVGVSKWKSLFGNSKIEQMFTYESIEDWFIDEFINRKD